MKIRSNKVCPLACKDDIISDQQNFKTTPQSCQSDPLRAFSSTECLILSQRSLSMPAFLTKPKPSPFASYAHEPFHIPMSRALQRNANSKVVKYLPKRDDVPNSQTEVVPSSTQKTTVEEGAYSNSKRCNDTDGQTRDQSSHLQSLKDNNISSTSSSPRVRFQSEYGTASTCVNGRLSDEAVSSSGLTPSTQQAQECGRGVYVSRQAPKSPSHSALKGSSIKATAGAAEATAGSGKEVTPLTVDSSVKAGRVGLGAGWATGRGSSTTSLGTNKPENPTSPSSGSAGSVLKGSAYSAFAMRQEELQGTRARQQTRTVGCLACF